MKSLSADNGYDSNSFRTELRDAGVLPLIKHRLYQPIDHAHNARLDDGLFNHRALIETVNSVVKRSVSASVASRNGSPSSERSS